MLRIKSVFNAFMASLIIMLVLIVVSLVFLIFTTKGHGHHTTLFGGIFFENTAIGGGTRVGIGIENLLPLGVIWVFLFIFFILVFGFYRISKKQKNLLLNQSNDNSNN